MNNEVADKQIRELRHGLAEACRIATRWLEFKGRVMAKGPDRERIAELLKLTKEILNARKEGK